MLSGRCAGCGSIRIAVTIGYHGQSRDLCGLCGLAVHEARQRMVIREVAEDMAELYEHGQDAQLTFAQRVKKREMFA